MQRSTLIRAALAAAALMELNRRQGEMIMGTSHIGRIAAPVDLDPKPPAQVPPGDLSDAVGDHDESDFDEADGDDGDDMIGDDEDE